MSQTRMACHSTAGFRPQRCAFSPSTAHMGFVVYLKLTHHLITVIWLEQRTQQTRTPNHREWRVYLPMCLGTKPWKGIQRGGGSKRPCILNWYSMFMNLDSYRPRKKKKPKRLNEMNDEWTQSSTMCFHRAVLLKVCTLPIKRRQIPSVKIVIKNKDT